MLDKLLKMDSALLTIKTQIAKYTALFEADGEIDATERAFLNALEEDAKRVDEKLAKVIVKAKAAANEKSATTEKIEALAIEEVVVTEKAAGGMEEAEAIPTMSGDEKGAGMGDLEEPMDKEDKENPTATFQLLGYDIVRQINLLNASGKVIETIKIEKGHLQSGGFSLGGSVPVGKYIVQIKGTYIPIVRGRAWYEGAEELNETVSINKIYKDQVINVLIDFKQEFSESPYYPPKQDNVAGKETSVSLQPPFGIKTINLIRTNSTNPVESWSIKPSEFQGQITVVLSDETEYGKYPDDRYAFEIIGYNKGEVWESFYSDKIDELRLTFKWKVESPPVSVTMNIDFDPRTIYFIKDDGTEELSVIPGESPHIEEVFFITPNIESTPKSQNREKNINFIKNLIL